MACQPHTPKGEKHALVKICENYIPESLKLTWIECKIYRALNCVQFSGFYWFKRKKSNSVSMLPRPPDFKAGDLHLSSENAISASFLPKCLPPGLWHLGKRLLDAKGWANIILLIKKLGTAYPSKRSGGKQSSPRNFWYHAYCIQI